MSKKKKKNGAIFFNKKKYSKKGILGVRGVLMY